MQILKFTKNNKHMYINLTQYNFNNIFLAGENFFIFLNVTPMDVPTPVKLQILEIVITKSDRRKRVPGYEIALSQAKFLQERKFYLTTFGGIGRAEKINLIKHDQYVIFKLNFKQKFNYLSQLT